MPKLLLGANFIIRPLYINPMLRGRFLRRNPIAREAASHTKASVKASATADVKQNSKACFVQPDMGLLTSKHLRRHLRSEASTYLVHSKIYASCIRPLLRCLSQYSADLRRRLESHNGQEVLSRQVKKLSLSISIMRSGRQSRASWCSFAG
jgi:hypothetical protein